MNSLFVDNTVFITRLKAGHIGRLVQALFEERSGTDLNRGLLWIRFVPITADV